MKKRFSEEQIIGFLREVIMVSTSGAFRAYYMLRLKTMPHCRFASEYLPRFSAWRAAVA